MTDKKELSAQLTKVLSKGLFVSAGEGLIISSCDYEEYQQSKAVKGFVHQMPICLSINAGGAGQYPEFINKYLTINEARLLAALLMNQIHLIETLPKAKD